MKAGDAQRRIACTISRLALAFVFLYHGLIPKLLFHDPGEYVILADAGLPAAVQPFLVNAAGVLEMLLGIVLLVQWRARWPLTIVLVFVIAATLAAAIFSPSLLTHAFNPLTLNVSVAALVLINLRSPLR